MWTDPIHGGEVGQTPQDLDVLPRTRFARIHLPQEAGIQEVFRYLASDRERTTAIATEVEAAIREGRKVLVLTERTEHLDAIKTALDDQVPAPLVLHGRMFRQERQDEVYASAARIGR